MILTRGVTIQRPPWQSNYRIATGSLDTTRNAAFAPQVVT